MSAQPAEIYCFHCRKAQPVKDLKSEATKFDSRKSKKPMSRDTWVGVCAVCGKSVRQFAKGAPKVPEAQVAPEAPAVAAPGPVGLPPQ